MDQINALISQFGPLGCIGGVVILVFLFLAIRAGTKKNNMDGGNGNNNKGSNNNNNNNSST